MEDITSAAAAEVEGALLPEATAAAARTKKKAKTKKKKRPTTAVGGKKKNTKAKKEKMKREKETAVGARARERGAVLARLAACAAINEGFALGFDLSTLPRDGSGSGAGTTSAVTPAAVHHPASVVDSIIRPPTHQPSAATDGPGSDVTLTFAVPVALLNHPRKPRKLVFINPSKLEKSFRKNKSQYIGEWGANERGDDALAESRRRVLGALRFFKTGTPVLVSLASLEGTGAERAAHFWDGKHRFCCYRDMGLKCIPLLVPVAQYKLFVKKFRASRGARRSTRKRVKKVKPAKAGFASAGFDGSPRKGRAKRRPSGTGSGDSGGSGSGDGSAGGDDSDGSEFGDTRDSPPDFTSMVFEDLCDDDDDEDGDALVGGDGSDADSLLDDDDDDDADDDESSVDAGLLDDGGGGGAGVDEDVDHSGSEDERPTPTQTPTPTATPTPALTPPGHGIDDGDAFVEVDGIWYSREVAKAMTR